MESGLYQEMYELEANYWWHRGKRFLIHQLLKKFLAGNQSRKRLLVPGVGTGYLQTELQDAYDVVGLDLSPLSLSFCRQRGCRSLVQVDLEQGLPFLQNQFDGILAFDVLEHIENDQYFLGECHRVLKPNAFLLLSVPAFPSLWSLWDEMLHHKRRYLQRGLAQQFEDHSLDVCLSNYINAVSFLPAVLIRKLKKWKQISTSEFVQLPDVINRMAALLYRLDITTSLLIPMPLGLSCVMVGRKAAR